MSHSISRDSGSVYPDQSLIKDQLDPIDSKTWFESKLPSGGVAPVSNKAYRDMTRYGTLKINDSIVYSPNVEIRPNQGAQAADHVFREVETRLDSTELAARAANLMNQDTGGEVLKLVAFKKRIVRLEKGIHKGVEVENCISTHSVIEKKRVIAINTNSSSFTLVMESLVQQTDLEDIESEPTYFKIKTTIDGSKKDLENKNSSKLNIKAAYTAESPTEAGALSDDYSGTRAGFWDSDSYLH